MRSRSSLLPAFATLAFSFAPTRAALAQAPVPPPTPTPPTLPAPASPGAPPSTGLAPVPRGDFGPLPRSGSAPAAQPGAGVPGPGIPNGGGRSGQPAAPPGPQGNPDESLDARIGAVLSAQGLTADEVARRAVATSYDIRSRREDVRAADATSDQVTAAIAPKLTLFGSYTRLSPITPPQLGVLVSPADPGFQSNGAVTPIPAGTPLVGVPLKFPVILDQWLTQAKLTVPLSDYLFRTSQSLSAAAKSQSAARLNERAVVVQTAANARISYYTWVRARLQIIAAEQALGQARSQLFDTQSAFQVGNVSRADVLRAESQVANSELVVVRARNLAELAEERLRVLTHDPPGATFTVGEDVRRDPPGALSDPGTLPKAYAEAMTKRLEIRALDDSAYSMREQAKVIRAAAYPRLDGVGEITYANPNQRILPQQQQWTATWSAGLQLTWSPNDLVSNVAAGTVQDARAAQVEAQKGALADSLRTEVMQAQQALREAQISVQTTARSLSAAEEGYRVRRELYKNGRATSVEVLDAQTNLLAARLAVIDSRVDLRIALVQLDHAMGRDAQR